MFRLEGFVDDKHLSKVMHNLDGLVIDLKVVPVRNAIQQKDGKLKSTAAGSTLDAILGYVNEHKLTMITRAQIKEALAANGFAPAGVGSAVTTAIKAKVLKKGKNRAEYVPVTTKDGR